MSPSFGYRHRRRIGLSSVLILLVAASAGAQQTPYGTTEVPYATMVMDGDISDWLSLRGPANRVLNMSWAHNQRPGPADSAPLVVNVQYAWDQQNLYFLVEELSDDDPSQGFDDVTWCWECASNGGNAAVAFWNTDSVGFYDKGIKWPGVSDDPVDAQTLETGPFTQFWVGLTTKNELRINGNPQYRHLARTVSQSLNEDNTGRLIGPRSEENDKTVPLVPDLSELTSPQSAASVIEDGSNGGRGRRVIEAFMRWDQIRYSSNDPRQEVQDRIEALLPALEGHLLEDVKAGYEFRLEPLLVDGANDFSWGSQTHPSGVEHAIPPFTTQWNEISVVRLLAGTPGDLDGDGDCDAADIDAEATAIRVGETASRYDLNGDGSVSDVDHTFLVEVLKHAYFGDADLNGEFTSDDFVSVFTAGEYEDGTSGNSGWAEGDWDGNADFDSSDFVKAFQTGGYELGHAPGVIAVPEPYGLSLFAVALAGLAMRYRRP